MDALDLTTRPPRSPRAKLGDLDLLMIARTVDKLRATLPGGNLGEYRIAGFSSRLLDALGIPEDALRQAIANADSDADVADWIRRRTDASRFSEIGEALERPTVGQRSEDPAYLERYPIARSLPPDMSHLDVLVADDAAAFASREAHP